MSVVDPADEQDVAWEEIAPLLKGENGRAIASALVGCSFFREDPDQALEIVKCSPSGSQLEVRSKSGSVGVVAVPTGYVITSPALRIAIEAGTSPALRQERQMRAAIAAFGIGATIEKQDIEPLYAAVTSVRTGNLPKADHRRIYLGLVERYASPKVLIKLTRAWSRLADNEVLPDILIALVAALRHTSLTKEALDLTEDLHELRTLLSDGERAILYTQRAALLTDRFEQTGDTQLLEDAQRCANTSWAIKQSHHCSMVYRRLEALRKNS